MVNSSSIYALRSHDDFASLFSFSFLQLFPHFLLPFASCFIHAFSPWALLLSPLHLFSIYCTAVVPYSYEAVGNLINNGGVGGGKSRFPRIALLPWAKGFISHLPLATWASGVCGEPWGHLCKAPQASAS